MTARQKKLDALDRAYIAGQLAMRNRVWREFRHLMLDWDRKNWNTWLVPTRRPLRGAK